MTAIEIIEKHMTEYSRLSTEADRLGEKDKMYSHNMVWRSLFEVRDELLKGKIG